MTTFAKITNPQRLRDWLAVFGTDTIPLRSPIPQLAGLPGLPGSQVVYMADLTKLDADQRQRLITFIAARFNVPADAVARDLDTVGLPILGSDVTITSNDIGLVLSAMDDDECEDLVVRRTCEYCGGEFRAGVTSCTCDDESWRELTVADLEDEEG